MNLRDYQPRWYLLNADHSYRRAKDFDDLLAHPDDAWARVAYDQWDEGAIYVSTVFLGLDHNLFGSGPPLLFETMVFGPYGGDEQWRYSTWAEAEAGHKEVVAEVQKRVQKVGDGGGEKVGDKGVSEG
jgi:hypothetical protein